MIRNIGCCHRSYVKLIHVMTIFLVFRRKQWLIPLVRKYLKVDLFGGLCTLVRGEYVQLEKCIICEDSVVIKLGSVLFCNVYLPVNKNIQDYINQIYSGVCSCSR